MSTFKNSHDFLLKHKHDSLVSGCGDGCCTGGHGSRLHFRAIDSPTQSNILSTQTLFLFLIPPPQETEHAPQPPHSPSPLWLSTSNKCINIKYVQ